MQMNWLHQNFLSVLLPLLFCSCSASAPIRQPAQKAPPDVEHEYRVAEAMAKAGDYKHALPRLMRFVEQYQVSELTANAYYLLGEMNLNEQRFSDALTDFKAILNLPVTSPLEPAATLSAARIQLKQSDPEEAEKTLDRAAHWQKSSTANLLEAEQLRAEALIAQKKYLPGLKAIVTLSDKSPTPAERDRYHAIALEVVESRLQEEDLREVAGSNSFSFLQPVAKYRFGVLSIDQHQFSRARDQLEGAIELVPGTELADRAKSLIQQIDARNHVDPHTIGVVLPLSGKQAGIGYKALHGIQLALGIFGSQGSPPSGFKLAVIDSEGSPDGARRAIERLVQEDGAIAIIGGMLSKTAVAEGAKAQEFGIPTIMLTQKSGITQTGDYVFRNSLTSQMQVQALVETAMTKLGMHNFAILYPNDAYGVEFANLFWDEVRSQGGNITGAQTYDSQETDFRGPIQRLVGTFYF
jgi:outer membrane PBP1 activator LpoA protein